MRGGGGVGACERPAARLFRFAASVRRRARALDPVRFEVCKEEDVSICLDMTSARPSAVEAVRARD